MAFRVLVVEGRGVLVVDCCYGEVADSSVVSSGGTATVNLQVHPLSTEVMVLFFGRVFRSGNMLLYSVCKQGSNSRNQEIPLPNRKLLLHLHHFSLTTVGQHGVTFHSFQPRLEFFPLF